MKDETFHKINKGNRALEKKGLVRKNKDRSGKQHVKVQDRKVAQRAEASGAKRGS